MAYYFFIGMTMLPVPPAKMTIKINNKNKTINLINEGEVNLIKTPGLTEISFDARLPNAPYPFADYDTSVAESLSKRLSGSGYSFKKADYFIDLFKAARKSGAPKRLIISRMTPTFGVLWDTNLLVTLEEYSIIEDAGEGFDVVAPLRFKQYRPYGTKECEVTTDEKGVRHINVKTVRPAPDMITPAAYQIRNEQSIWEVCQKAAGGNLDWRKVMKDNGIGNPSGAGLRGTVLRLG